VKREAGAPNLTGQGNSGAAPATVSENSGSSATVSDINDMGRRSTIRMDFHPLTSPETGLRRNRCVAEGDETRAK